MCTPIFRTWKSAELMWKILLSCKLQIPENIDILLATTCLYVLKKCFYDRTAIKVLFNNLNDRTNKIWLEKACSRRYRSSDWVSTSFYNKIRQTRDGWLVLPWQIPGLEKEKIWPFLREKNPFLYNFHPTHLVCVVIYFQRHKYPTYLCCQRFKSKMPSPKLNSKRLSVGNESLIYWQIDSYMQFLFTTQKDILSKRQKCVLHVSSTLCFRLFRACPSSYNNVNK